MKLASLIRRSLPFTANARAGIPPTWDRPDPPETQKTPRTRRLTTQEKHFSFFDAASPTFMLVNSQVAEGDLIQAFPKFAKNFLILVLTGCLFGSVGYLWSSKTTLAYLPNFSNQADRLKDERQNFQTKYGLKDLQSNPWNLNVWPESFPIKNLGVCEQYGNYEDRKRNVDTIRQINKQAQAYWNKLYSDAEEELKSGNKHH